MKIRLLVVAYLALCISGFSQTLSNSNLPIVIITTALDPNTGLSLPIVDEPKVIATMKIISRPDGTRNYVSDATNPTYLNYNGLIGIEIRGSTSADLPKKPYGLTTYLADGVTDNNVSLLGMPSEHDWILNSLAFDQSLIRDKFSYDLSRAMGNYAPRSRYCEVIINGQYAGLYMLMEKIKLDANRVNIERMNPLDNTIPAVTGGYITKADKLGADPVAWTMSSYGSNTNMVHDTPKPEFITSTQNAYIKRQFTLLDTLARIVPSYSIVNGVPSVIDVPSFIDFMLSSELASNVDSYQFSSYFHKDRNGKLRAGPIWDYNLTYGNDLKSWGYDRSFTNVWQFYNLNGLYYDNTGPKFWKGLYDNAVFKCYLTKRWQQLTQAGNPMDYNIMVAKIDSLNTLVSEAAAREQTKWQAIPNHTSDIALMKTWLSDRITWMNGNLNNSTSCANPSLPPLVISKINYNPDTTTGNNLEFIEITNNGNSTVNLTGVYFRQLGMTYRFPSGSSVGANQKIFLAEDTARFREFYGFKAFDLFHHELSDNSFDLLLSTAYGDIIDRVIYSDTSPWPLDADGAGAYLSLTDLNSDNSLASSWTASRDCFYTMIPPVVQNFQFCQYGAATPLQLTPLKSTKIVWYDAPGSLQPLAEPVVPPTTQLGTIEYYAAQVSSHNCESPRVKVTVTIVPVAAPAAQNFEACLHSFASPLSVTPITGTTIRWYESIDAQAPFAGAATPNTAVVDTLEYFISHYTAQGCESPRSKVQVFIKPFTAPVVQNFELCHNATPEPLQLSAISGASINWFNSADGNTYVGMTVTPPTSSIGTLEYYASQVTANGCESERVKVTVLIKELPQPPALIYSELSTEDISFSSSATTNNKWYLNGDLIEGESGQMLRPKVNGTYQVTVTENGCESQLSDPYVLIITGLGDSDKNSLIGVYPNPVKDELKVTLPETATGNSEISIFDLTGKKWYNQLAFASHSINVSWLTSGAYLIQIKNGRLGLINKKFIKL
jgi:hypothetical protein